MATQALTGSGVQYTDRRDFYVKPKTYAELWPSVTPFTSSLMMGNQKPKDVLYKLFEHEGPWRRQYFDNNGSSVTVGTGNSDSSSITIDGITGLASSADDSYLGMIVECWDSTLKTNRGQAVITAVPSTTTIQVRGLSGANSIVTVDNDRWFVLAQVGGEGASAPEAYHDELNVVWNSVTEFRVTVEITQALRDSALRGAPDELIRLNREALHKFKIQQERQSLFGINPVGTNLAQGDTFTDSTGGTTSWRTDAEGNILRMTYGALAMVEDYGDTSGDDQSNFTLNEATFTWGDYVDISEKTFQYLPNSGFKKAYCGRGAMSIWSKAAKVGLFGNSDWRVDISDFKKDKIGFSYKMLETPHGLLQLIPTPVMDGPRNNWMLIIDEDNIFQAVAEKNAFHQDIKTDNRPTIQKNEYSGKNGIGMELVNSHALIKFT